MNVEQLREALARMPNHWPVHVAVRAGITEVGHETGYFFTLDCEQANYPSLGKIAVISINYDPK